MKRSKRSSPGPPPAGAGDGENHQILDRVAAFEILKRTEVRVAMKWAASLAYDIRYIAIRAVMKYEDIWRFWLRRDMGDYRIDWAPNARTAYLWYRFAIATCQRAILRNNWDIPNSKLLYLNHTEDYDFRDYFPQKLRLVNAEDYDKSAIDLMVMLVCDPGEVLEQLQISYPQMIESLRDAYGLCIDGLMEFLQRGDASSELRDFFLPETLAHLQKPPRIVEETHLIVASPLYMEEYAPILEKERLEMQEHARLIGAKSIHTFVNFNANDKEDAPAGVVTRHEPKSTVHPDAIPIDALQYLIMVPILGEHKDEEFDAAKLMEAIPQYAQRNPPAINDERSWNPELGSENSFAGVFKTNDGSRETKHFICVQASVPTTSKALRTFIAKNPKMTYEQLVNAPEYHSAHYVASRNAARIAYNVARALKVPIHHMEDSGRNAPQRAVPSFSQTSSTVRAIGSEVGVFSKVRPVESAGSQKFHAVYAGPYDGIALFHMDGKAKGIGLPVTTGYGERKSVNAPVSEKRAKGIVWEGNAKMHPDMHKDSFIAADADQFISAMRGTGWSETGIKSVTRFVPVAVKVFNPELKRMK